MIASRTRTSGPDGARPTHNHPLARGCGQSVKIGVSIRRMYGGAQLMTEDRSRRPRLSSSGRHNDAANSRAAGLTAGRFAQGIGATFDQCRQFLRTASR